MDDLIDQWTHRRHAAERRWLINWLQMFSEEHSVRVTFISGDSHSCGAGLLETISKEKKVGDDVTDFRLMFSICSSAIVNVPPPRPLLYLLHIAAILHRKIISNIRGSNLKESLEPWDVNSEIDNCFLYDVEALIAAGTHTINHLDSIYFADFFLPSMENYLKINGSTVERMLEIFPNDVDGSKRNAFSNMIMDRRNWCEVNGVVFRSKTDSGRALDLTSPI